MDYFLIKNFFDGILNLVFQNLFVAAFFWLAIIVIIIRIIAKNEIKNLIKDYNKK
ncbi:MAG: hypothetical protein CFH19_01136 [Alphaproteobacteria bacterium MarineAlpha5_Bin9]|nr:MAG: hypothetical protein CFH19_01136 [Alphaproteobacteria bacterium MarineAlpha5_Bin9]|tara:strand:+ start:5154 stop:5318 length:165 start_codon:yes stop_codon:yes gene_type:complete